MTQTITILNQTTVPNPANLASPSIAVMFAIRDTSISNTWYRDSTGGIPGDTADIQAFLNAEFLTLYAQAAAVGVTMTQNQVDTQTYLWQAYSVIQSVAYCSYLLETTLLNSADLTVVGNYRAVLTTVLTAMQNAAFPASFTNHFTQERIARGINGAVNTFTIAQCQEMDRLIHGWLNDRATHAIYAKLISGIG